MANYLLLIVLISCNILVCVNCAKPVCYVCNSATQEHCKILDPVLGDFSLECDTDLEDLDEPPTNLCYTQVNGIHVTRKCLVDETLEFQTECDGNPLCTPCDGNECNTQNVAPLECIVCNSTDNPNCATLRQPITTTEQCELVDDECFVGIADGITYRGCLSAAGSLECPTGACEKCTNTDSCNSAIYPSARLSCHHCNEHVNCNGVQEPENSYPCQNYVADDSCYIIGMGAYAQRGCLSDSDEFSKNCTDNRGLCTTCDATTSASGCNGQGAVEVREMCYVCDETNPYCFAHVDNSDDETKVALECKLFLNYDLQCFTYTNENQIIRGCLNHVEQISPPECFENSANCNICPTELCNRVPVLEIGDYCINCDSSDPKCDDPEHILSLTKDCYSNPGKITGNRCYLKLDNVSERGCITDLGDDMLADCNENNEKCKTCLGENCNQKLGYTTCYGCNSTVDESCVNSGTIPVLCDDYLDTCLTFVNEPNETVRGCTIELDPKSHDVTCSSWNCDECSENNCNGKMFPADRLKCIKCASATASDCLEITDQSIASHSVTCVNYVSDDSCFTIVNGNFNVTRGCISDQDVAAIECANEDKFCIQCPTENCNSNQLDYKPVLSCIQCNQTDPKCEWGFHENDATPCTRDIFFDEQERCYTYQKGNEIQRGCILDDEKCLTSDAACTTCGSHGCNSLHLRQSQCIVCDSTDVEQKFCESEIEEGDLTSCSNGIQSYEYRGCYTYQTDIHVHRGCITTLTEAEFAYCGVADNINCDLCYPDGCNNQEPNYASRLYYLSTLTLLCISLLVKLLK